MSLEEVVYPCVDHALQLLLFTYHRVHLGHLAHLRYLTHLVHGHHLPHLIHLAHVHHGVKVIGRLRLILHAILHIDFLYFFVESLGIVSFGPRGEPSKSVLYKIVVIEKLLLLALVGSTHLIEFSDILVFDFLHHSEISSLAGGVFEVHISEIGVINVHLADGSQKFGSV